MGCANTKSMKQAQKPNSLQPEPIAQMIQEAVIAVVPQEDPVQQSSLSQISKIYGSDNSGSNIMQSIQQHYKNKDNVSMFQLESDKRSQTQPQYTNKNQSLTIDFEKYRSIATKIEENSCQNTSEKKCQILQWNQYQTEQQKKAFLEIQVIQNKNKFLQFSQNYKINILQSPNIPQKYQQDEIIQDSAEGEQFELEIIEKQVTLTSRQGNQENIETARDNPAYIPHVFEPRLAQTKNKRSRLTV